MSAYGHQMEQEYSAENLSSGGNSELDSHYVESGFYMTSLAATIFVAALATFGVLLVTLVISLFVMLQSCESSRAGVVETPNSDYEFHTCKTLALHAELNNGEAVQFPITCKALAIRYIEEGQYSRDLNMTMWVLENYLKRIEPLKDGRDLFLLDIDDILLPNLHNTNLSLQRDDQYECSHCIGVARNLKHTILLRIFTKLHASRYNVVLMSRKPEGQRNVISEHLHSAGYRDWSSLMMRSEDEVHIDSHEYFSRRRAALLSEGFQLVGTISSRFDALTGSFSAGLVLKLPNSIYYSFDNQIEIADTTA